MRGNLLHYCAIFPLGAFQSEASTPSAIAQALSQPEVAMAEVTAAALQRPVLQAAPEAPHGTNHVVPL